ncbi:glycosyltransferase [Ectothiorhodospira sp. BSL-9]|uniref:O-linked N-acetylglucosamine transferase family protein n=1 Tax=Ectothiorhodospira sp. BSL-9 TaxID=1442136 RepID=UPI0007B52B17|nr:glycosyltransferase [Ectothiorhodospira sp. BSL-9]
MNAKNQLNKAIQSIENALKAGDMQAVERQCTQGLRRFPNHPVLLCALSRYHQAQGRTEQARQTSERAIAKGGLNIAPVVAHHVGLMESNREWEEAVKLLQRALKNTDNRFALELLLARQLCRANRRGEALPIFKNLVSQQPTAALLNDYAYCLFDLGYQEDGLRQLRLATALDPNNLVIRSNVLLQAHYLPDMTAEELLSLHKEWFETCARLYGRTREFQRRPMEGRPLRVGFISNGFRAHPAGWLSFGSLSVLANYFDTEVYLYSTHPPSEKDQLVPQMREFADQWLSVFGWTTEALFKRLLDDELDVLVDMAGHSEHSAIPVVAARAAPVQVKWVGGLFNTSAVPNMDYLLSDWVETPEGAEANYTEALVRLPGGYVTYTPPPYMPEVNELPALTNGYVTFGCFNNAYKINPTIARVWADILTQVPGSRLLLKDKRYGDPTVRDHYLKMFTEAGTDPERITLEPESPHDELLKSYHRIDIALDPWPYSGGLSTVEALYMGVPVITHPGPTFAGRHAASHITNVGLGDWVVGDFEGYVGLAVEQSSQLDDLSRLRLELRQCCKDSALGNHLQMSANIDEAFRVMFRQWTSGKALAAINFNKHHKIPLLPENPANGKGYQLSCITNQGILSNIVDPIKAKLIIGMITTFSNQTSSTIDEIICNCEKAISTDPRNNTAFFVLVHALQQSSPHSIEKTLATDLLEKLSIAGWQSRFSLYSYWLSSVENIRSVDKPAASAVIITNNIKPETIDTAKELRRQGNKSLDIILVINGLNISTPPEIKKYINTLITLRYNSGAYLARNIGAIFTQGSILIFVDDDGQPMEGFVAGHIELHSRKAIACVRGICQPRKGSIPQHYHLGNQESYAPPILEGNVSFKKTNFFDAGGWGDYIFFGHGGFDISYRLIKMGLGRTTQIYSPKVGIYHEYSKSPDRTQQKRKCQNASWLLLEHLHKDLTPTIHNEFSANILQPNGDRERLDSQHPNLAGATTETLPGFSREASDLISDYYRKSRVILEYGSGESTVFASKLENKRIFSVENDLAWAQNLEHRINTQEPASNPIVHRVNIGETGKWAKPLNDSNWTAFHRYPLEIWDQPYFEHPDVILIDGRFRVACFLTALLRVEKPTTILFDDYAYRERYKVIERLIKPDTIIDRMAVFHLEPTSLPRSHLTWIVGSFNEVTYAEEGDFSPHKECSSTKP